MRYTRPTKKRLRKEARSIPYKVRGDEKLFRCWNCGFICNADRDDSSGGQAGDNHMVYSYPALGGSGLDGTIVSVELGKKSVLMEQDADGVNRVVTHIFSSVVTKGCPLCGTTNYKG